MEVRKAQDLEAMKVYMEAFCNVTDVWGFIDEHGNASVDYWIAFGENYDINLRSVSDTQVVCIIHLVDDGILVTGPDSVFSVWVIERPSKHGQDSER